MPFFELSFILCRNCEINVFVSHASVVFASQFQHSHIQALRWSFGQTDECSRMWDTHLLLNNEPKQILDKGWLNELVLLITRGTVWVKWLSYKIILHESITYWHWKLNDLLKNHCYHFNDSDTVSWSLC